MKTAIVTGESGQDAHYLIQLLLNQGYRVIGTTHQKVKDSTCYELNHDRLVRYELDITSSADVSKFVGIHKPDEIYNLAARSSSAQFFDDPYATAQVNAMAVMNFLEAIRQVKRDASFCHVSSSEVFAGSLTSPQNEATPVAPLNAYGAAKAYGMHLVSAYRAQFGIKAASAVVYNHESIRRSSSYVTRKITSAAARISLGLTKKLVLANLNSQRDWMHAQDAVRGMWLMMQSKTCTDFVFGSGVLHSIQDICEVAFSHLSLDFRNYVEVQSDPTRRVEGVPLCADASKALELLSWRTTIAFEDMIRQMVDHDLQSLR